MILKRRGKEFQIGKFRIVLIVMQTANGFRKPTKLIIILIITKENPSYKRGYHSRGSPSPPTYFEVL